MAGSFDGRMSTRGVEQDEKTLLWYSKGREKHLSLNSVPAVVLGQKTVNFLRHRCPEKESQSLSIIYKNGERSLDLICSDRDQAEYWYLGLRALTSAAPCSPCSSIGSRSSRHINSCTSTPRSYIPRTSRLPTVHGTPRHIQLHPSHKNPKKTQGNIFGGNVDCSGTTFYPRQCTFSDVDTYLEKLTRKISNPEIHGLKDVIVGTKEKVQKITQTSRLKTLEGPRAACRLDSLKDVFFWGDVPGSMLDCDNISKALPRFVDSTNMLDVQSIACGENHAAIITKHGEVYFWGNESSGIIGHQVNTSVSRPKVVESLASLHVKAEAYGSKHTCAVTVSGELFEWDEGAHMGLWNDCCGKNQWFPPKLPSPIDSVSVVKIACGPWHTAIITSSGQLYTYGEGTFGVLGHGDTQGISRPKEVECLKGSRVKSVACGPWHTAAIVEVIGSFKSDAPSSKLFTWGDAGRGKLGHSDKKMKLVPTCVDSLADYDFIQVSCGMALTVVLTISGKVLTIGSSIHGQLGSPQADGKSICSVEGLLKNEFVRQISSGSSHVAVLTASGKVLTWGKGREGQLGLGDYINRNSPSLVEALESRHVESISCGYNYTAAICLHKAISRKDLSICSGCKMAFGFTKKKHNCYNCGSVFCNSCSSNKVAKAALAPDKTRRYRVCDACFGQLQIVVGSGKINSELNTGKGDMFKTEVIRAYTPKLSRMFKDANLPVEKMVLVRGPSQWNDDPATPIQVKSRKWGQVECPAQFVSAHDSFQYQPILKHHICASSVSQRMYGPVVLKSGGPLQQPDGQRKELNSTEILLTAEIKQLRSQVTILAEKYQQKSLQVELYKQKLDETWLIVRDEAAKCKAAKDVIKVLTDQCNALSGKLSISQQLDNSRITSDSGRGPPVTVDLQHYPSKKLTPGKSSELTNIKNHQGISQRDDELAPSTNADVPCHHNGARTFGSDDYVTEAGAHVAPAVSSGVIEQIERGVYVTFAVSPGGRKDIR